MNGNYEVPRRGVLLFVAPLATLLALFMFFFFASDEWTAPRVVLQAGFSALAIGLVVATVSPTKGVWGLRLVAFTIFAAYFIYLVDQFWFSGQELTLASRRSQPSPLSSILGFLAFGIPSLIYALWGSTSGRLPHITPERATWTDITVFWCAWAVRLILLGLSALIVAVGVWRWWSGH